LASARGRRERVDGSEFFHARARNCGINVHEQSLVVYELVVTRRDHYRSSLGQRPFRWARARARFALPCPERLVIQAPACKGANRQARNRGGGNPATPHRLAALNRSSDRGEMEYAGRAVIPVDVPKNLRVLTREVVLVEHRVRIAVQFSEITYGAQELRVTVRAPLARRQVRITGRALDEREQLFIREVPPAPQEVLHRSVCLQERA
jgi:hypothetical protein